MGNVTKSVQEFIWDQNKTSNRDILAFVAPCKLSNLIFSTCISKGGALAVGEMKVSEFFGVSQKVAIW